MKKINCSTKKKPNIWALVDDRDFDIVNKWKWRPITKFNYIGRWKDSTCKKIILLHRFLLNAKAGEEVDHIDHNPLNNQRSNLRICNNRENKMNLRKHRGTSIYKGVSWNSRNQKWQSFIRYKKNKNLNLGSYKNELHAAMAYNCAARIFFGQFAFLNKV